MENILTVGLALFYVFVSIKSSSTTAKVEIRVCPTASYQVRDTHRFPNPQIDIASDHCGRGCKKSWICDPFRVITVEQADNLDDEIEEIYKAGKCACSSCKNRTVGYRIAIALVPSLKYIFSEITDNATKKSEDFASILRSQWNYGQCGNDIVIFLSKKENVIQIAVGNATSNSINRKCFQSIQRKADLLESDTPSILHYIINRLRDVLQHDTCNSPDEVKPWNTTLIAICIALGLLLLVLLISVFLHRQGKCQTTQRYGIELPPITISVRKPHKHHKHKDRTTHSNEEQKLSIQNGTDGEKVDAEQED